MPGPIWLRINGPPLSIFVRRISLTPNFTWKGITPFTSGVPTFLMAFHPDSLGGACRRGGGQGSVVRPGS
ncbi:MAG: hypothetical protein ACREA0_29235, partial [bacterium]